MPIDPAAAYRVLAQTLRMAVDKRDVQLEVMLREHIARLELPHCMWAEPCPLPCRMGGAFCEAHHAEVVGYSDALNECSREEQEDEPAAAFH